MSLKGYPSQEKDAAIASQHVTVEQVRKRQHALSTIAHSTVRQVGVDAVEASSTVRVINATAHLAEAGDVICFTSGALNGVEVKVFSVDTNTITLVEDLASAPVAAVTFEIMRHKYGRVDASGNLVTTSGPMQIRVDGVDTFVQKDSVTATNTVPIPVEIVAAGSGVAINVTTGDIGIQTSHAGANPDSVRIGDGTDELAINADGSINIGSSALPTGASTSALQTTGNTSLSSIDGKLTTSNNNTGGILTQVTTNGTNQATAAKQDLLLAELQLKADLTDTQPVSVASLPLPTGAATSALQTTGNTSLGNIDTKVATETTLAAASAKLPATLGQKAMTASLAVAIASDQSSIPVAIAAPTAATVKQATVTVGTTAVRCTHDGAAVSATRRFLSVMPSPDTTTARFWIGSSSVASSGANRGIEAFPGATFERADDAGEYYIISDTAAQVVHILEQE